MEDVQAFFDVVGSVNIAVIGFFFSSGMGIGHGVWGVETGMGSHWLRLVHLWPAHSRLDGGFENR